MTDYKPKDRILETIQKMSGRYAAYEIFTDWVKSMALCISNYITVFKDQIWKDREEEYLAIMAKYSKEEQLIFCEMMAWLAETLEDNMEDALGYIYMNADMGSKSAGQFFTPFHLSELVAKIGVDALKKNDEVYQINEPSSGGGGMIIAAAKAMKEAGINYQKRLKVVAQDLDWKGVYMTYVQLSLLGIKAVCVQGDTLQNPYIPGRTEESHCLYTPAWRGALL